MCGIAGLMQRGGQRSQQELEQIARRMSDAIRHRGPDADGVWASAEQQLALGHRRLSILDLSEAGAQPMHSHSARYVLSYNGEIYNFRDLRKELQGAGATFTGHSDTEVLLAAIDTWGIETSLERIDGMFAFALWDRQTQTLTLARDRAGKKPLYYGWFGKAFGFASELKALRQHPEFDRALDLDALADFVVYSWVPNPASIYNQVRKLPPGSWIQISAQDAPFSVEPRPYWQARDIAEAGAHAPWQGGYEAAVDELETRLTRAVEERMVADVDLGALLSGGIDSSVVVALMQKVSDRPVRTFTIGFNEDQYNEAPFAADVARSIGTEHHELYVSPQQALDVVNQLPQMYDEPFADASQIPTHLVCALARQSVTVVLSGDGGDELFCGYNRYQRCIRQWQALQRYPMALRRQISGFQHWLRDASWRGLGPKDPFSAGKPGKLGKPLARLGRNWNHWLAGDLREYQASDFRKGHSGSRFVPGAQSQPSSLTDQTQWANVESLQTAICHYDYLGYLTDDILVKVDRASMAVSLEVRSPLLDQRVLELAWSLPDDYVVSGDGGKRVLKDLLYRHVPRELVDRPKKGFGVPVKLWLKNELRPWAEDLLSEDFLRRQGIFDVAAVRAAWGQHLCGWDNHSELLWAVLMFQSWWLEESRSS